MTPTARIAQAQIEATEALHAALQDKHEKEGSLGNLEHEIVYGYLAATASALVAIANLLEERAERELQRDRRRRDQLIPRTLAEGL